jgi:four helix bundle protein
MSFENLRVYQAAELFDKMVIALVARIPRGFARDIDQLKRASASIAYNIAEAHGSDDGRKVLHLQIARGSTDEARSVLRRIASRGGLTQVDIYKPCGVAITIAKMLTTWISRIS